MKHFALAMASTLTAMLFLSGCYFTVRDARTGKMYYTDKWVAADGYSGPLTFEDHTGRRIRLERADVVRLNKKDYLESTEPGADAEAAPEPKPERSP